MQVAGIPVATLAFPKTVRLVSTARLREAVLASLVDTSDELAELAEIEAATSSRLQAQATGISGLAANELVYDVPHAHFINACFAYAKPREPNRFNGANRGAWYSALVVETCLAEISFHMTSFLSHTGVFEAVVEYAEMFSSVSGDFVDLRAVPDHPALDPDKARGYPLGNALADDTRRAGANGIIYPSVRHSGGTCFAVLRPAAVQSVRQGDVYRLVWSGKPTPVIEGPVNAPVV
ncbi:RES family NAD+ phosphorylase [Rhizobium sp. G187]|uniref:RES family NAD+ phosphorylase n=1 Tax=Rhizobium sp. G187 TaxID=3451352 RepID=UPI003EE5B96A